MTVPACGGSSRTRFPAASHTRTFLPAPAARRLPAGCQASVSTHAAPPAIATISRPASASQSRTLPSCPAEASKPAARLPGDGGGAEPVAGQFVDAACRSASKDGDGAADGRRREALTVRRPAEPMTWSASSAFQARRSLSSDVRAMRSLYRYRRGNEKGGPRPGCPAPRPPQRNRVGLHTPPTKVTGQGRELRGF